MISKTKPKNFKKKFDVVGCFMECQSEILLLQRLDSKPQGGTWGIPGGKVDVGEDLVIAITREVREETGLSAEPHQYEYFDKFYVRYPEFDFIYHIFYLPFESKPQVNINTTEHKNIAWKIPAESLKLNLIPDGDYCIKAFYKL